MGDLTRPAKERREVWRVSLTWVRLADSVTEGLRKKPILIKARMKRRRVAL